MCHRGPGPSPLQGSRFTAKLQALSAVQSKMTIALRVWPVLLAACDQGGEAPVDCQDVLSLYRPAGASRDYPEGPYGVEVGDRLAPLELSDCDDEPLDLAALLCDPATRLLLLNVGAGWCLPCIEETRELVESGLHVVRAEQGLRIVQVLYEDEDAERATRTFCRQWTEEYGMCFPVLTDPLFSTNVYFDRSATPVNMLIDRDAVIRYKVTAQNPVDLEANVEALLEEAE